MNRKVFIGLIVLMGIALLGIITIQVVWLRNSIQVRNELFDRSVFDALSQSSRNIEKMKDAKDLHNLYFAPHINATGFYSSANDSTINTNSFYREFKMHYDSNDTISAGSPKVWTNSSSKTIIKMIDTNDAAQIIRREEVVIDYDSIMLEIKDDIDRNIQVFIANKNETDESSDSVDIQIEFNGGFNHRAQHYKNVAKDMVDEVWTWNAEPKIDTTMVAEVLKKELNALDIPISFEFGVFKDKSLKANSFGADSLKLLSSQYKVKMYPNDFFSRNLTLSLYFPERSAFVFKSLILPATLSLIFCAVILITFTLSIFYLLRQKKISDMKSDFINNMTHEFKTPLATISVASDSIVNPKVIEDADKIRYFTSMIKQENIRMNKQVETILQIAKLDKKDYQFKFETVNIHDIIENACDGMELQLQKREGQLLRKLNANNPMVTTDAVHFLNVMNNLLDNANKYTAENPVVEVETHNNDKGVWISVKDNGKGMSRQVQSRIFERFYRETSGNVHNVKGFGLGLSFVQAIIQANKGLITVKSEPGEGSIFEVFIPFTLNAAKNE